MSYLNTFWDSFVMGPLQAFFDFTPIVKLGFSLDSKVLLYNRTKPPNTSTVKDNENSLDILWELCHHYHYR